MITLAEARKVAAVIATADGGGCASCVGDLAAKMTEAFPQFAFKLAGTADEDEYPLRVTVKRHPSEAHY